MTSIIKVDTLQDTGGNTILSSDGAGTITQTRTGITMADQWRLTADFTGNANPIASNLEQVDTSGMGTIGTAMSESSGIFTFPSTGIYLVTMNMDAVTLSTTIDGLVTGFIMLTTDNSTYTEIARTNAGIADPAANVIENSGSCSALIDVTNTSTHKVSFKMDSVSATTTIKGDTLTNETHFTFIRLGDT